MAEQEGDLLKEGREAAEAAARAARTRKIEDIEAAVKEIDDVIRVGIKKGLVWPMWVALAIAIGVGSFSIYRSVNHTPSPVAVLSGEDDTAKLIKDGFAGMKADLKAISDRLDKRPDAPPKPPMPGPDVPKPPSPGGITLPESVKTKVGGGLVKINAKANGPVTWVVPPVKGIDVEPEGDKLFLSATAEGEYWIGAVTVIGGKASAPEWVRVIVGDGPRPPPGPGPKPPTPPAPPDWPPVVLDQLGKDVATHASKVGRKSESAALAGNYAVVAKEIREGKIDSVEAAVRRLYVANTASIGGNSATWNGFFTWADNELTRRAEKGLLKTMPQHADVFEQFSGGLMESSK